MIELLKIDCMEYMATLPDKAFDLAIVDPGYGIGVSKREYMGGGKGGTSMVIQKNGSRLQVKRNKYLQKDWDNKRAGDKYFNELFRVSKNQIIWGGNYFSDMLPPSKGWIVWNKEQSGNYGDCELAWTSFERAITMYTVRWNGMIQYDMKNKEDRIHPTQKPILLYKHIITDYANRSERIIDTHGGSMSIALACHDLGFDLVCCEKDMDYFDAAVKRYKNHIKQLKAF